MGTRVMICRAASFDSGSHAPQDGLEYGIFHGIAPLWYFTILR